MVRSTYLIKNNEQLHRNYICILNLINFLIVLLKKHFSILWLYWSMSIQSNGCMVLSVYPVHASHGNNRLLLMPFSTCLQCFDAVDWAAGRASDL